MESLCAPGIVTPALAPIQPYYIWVERDNCGQSALSRGAPPSEIRTQDLVIKSRECEPFNHSALTNRINTFFPGPNLQWVLLYSMEEHEITSSLQNCCNCPLDNSQRTRVAPLFLDNYTMVIPSGLINAE